MMKNKYALSFSVLFLTACSLVPDYQRPNVEIPTQWHDAELQTSQKTRVDSQWWKAFGSQELNKLMREALVSNNDIGAAKQRVEQARAQAKMASSGLFPSVNVEGSFANTHNNSGDTQKIGIQPSISYEVDLWQANRAKSDAGSARLLSQVFARDALQLVVMSNVGQAYFNLLATNERKRIAQEFLENVTKVLAIIEAKQRAGAVSALDVAQQQTELATAKANLDLLTQQCTLAENALSILLGHAPQQQLFDTQHFFDVNLPRIQTQQPVNLLDRRPDIKQAEMQLIASNIDIGVAKAAFYPKLQVNLDTILAAPQPLGIALNIASSLTQPLFQGGRLEGNLENSQAVNAELVEIYKKTILTAFKEVEDAAAIHSNSTRRLSALTQAVEKAKSAYELSLERYRLGAIDYQTLLTTQRTLLTAENSQVQARLDVLVSMVQIYQAFGGGIFISSATNDNVK